MKNVKGSHKNIQHINFIDEKVISLTYANMIVVFILGLLIIGLIIGGQKYRVSLAQKEVISLTNQVLMLKAENEKKAKSRAQQEEDLAIADAQKQLLKIFDRTLSWPQILREVTIYMNPSVWLQSIESSDKQPTDGYQLSVRGRALDAEAVAVLVKNLAQSKLFKDVVLLSSKQTKDESAVYYDFSIDVKAYTSGNKKEIR